VDTHVIRPTIPELLDNVAASLDQTVLPELAPGAARNQLQAAIALIRRAAMASEATGPYLWADNADIAATLRKLAPPLGLLAPESTPACRYPTITELRERNLSLQRDLESTQQTLRTAPQDQRESLTPILRALIERMVQREARLNVSPSGG
jgi:hypothetical protein